jgi:hypothetical protein
LEHDHVATKNKFVQHIPIGRNKFEEYRPQHMQHEQPMYEKKYAQHTQQIRKTFAIRQNPSNPTKDKYHMCSYNLSKKYGNR